MNTRRTSPFPRGQIPVFVRLTDGTGMWRGIKDLTDHDHLCKSFGLDPISTYFDLPSSARSAGSVVSGHGGTRGNRRINGYVMRRGQDTPIGVLLVVKEDERFRDDDPCNESDFMRLD